MRYIQNRGRSHDSVSASDLEQINSTLIIEY
nr:MAG TPA: hypothetical protein [Caudoviricetes sp.]